MTTQLEMNRSQDKSENENESQITTLDNYQLTRDRRDRFPFSRIDTDEFVTYSKLEFVNFEPMTFEEAINCKESKGWNP